MAAALEHVPLALYYDHDTRVEISTCNQAVKGLSKSVACLIPEWSLDRNHNGSYTFKNVKNLSDAVEYRTGYPLTDEATFRDQACPGAGTAFAVTRNTVMTAGHCVAGILQHKMKVVFNFCLGKENFAANEVYDVKNIMYEVTDQKINKNLEKPDWAWMELDRDIEGRDPLPVDMTPPEKNNFVSLIGHPSGISMKYCDGAVEDISHETYFTSKFDSFQGNSGSPVFNAYNQVIGILYAGITDYEFRENYKGTGKTRTEWRRVTQALIDQCGYPKCHRIEKTMLAVARKINEVGLYTINEKMAASNAYSAALFKPRQDSEDFYKRHKFINFLSEVATLFAEEHSKRLNEHYVAKKLCSLGNGGINYAEASAFYTKIVPTYRWKEMPEDPHDYYETVKYLRNMVAYQVSKKEAIKIDEFEETFERDFKVPYSRESVQALLRG